MAGPYSDFFTVIRGGEEYLTALDANQAAKASLREALGISAASDDTLIINLAAPNPTFLQKVALVAALPVRQDVIERHGIAGPRRAIMWATVPTYCRSGSTRTTSLWRRTRFTGVPRPGRRVSGSP